MIRAALLRILGLTPPGVKRWVYRHPRALGPLARLVRGLAPAGGPAVVTFRRGPNVGLKWAVDRATPNYYWLNDYEREVERALRPYLRPGAVAADVGAHVGFDTLMFSRRVGGAGRVLSFEPDPANMRRLRHNCELNRLENVELFEQAVADFQGPLPFVAEGKTTGHLARPGGELPHDAPGGGGASTAETPGAMTGAISVECVTLDAAAFARTPPRLDVVKIDVEDHEVAVLAGAGRVLAELKPVLLIEIHSPASLDGCRRILRAAGYALEALVPGAAPEAGPPDATGDRAADDAAAGANFRIVHILACPA